MKRTHELVLYTEIKVSGGQDNIDVVKKDVVNEANPSSLYDSSCTVRPNRGPSNR